MSVQTRVTQISGVTTKTTAKGDLYVIDAGGTEYSTFQGALANQAYQLVGKNVELRYTEKAVSKDGRTYTNRYYEGAEETAGGFGQTSSSGFNPQQQTLPAFSGPSDMQPLAFPPAMQSDNGREGKIMRQTATKVAALLMPYLPEAERTPTGLLAMADYLVLYYEHGSGATQPMQANDPGPQPVPAGSFYDTQPSSDSDIPF